MKSGDEPSHHPPARRVRMPAPSIAELRAFLKTLEAAGVPLGLGPDWRSADDELARRVAAGEPLEEAIEDPALGASPSYRRFQRLASQGVPVATILERLHREASHQDASRRKLNRGFAYPVFVAVAAAAGLLTLGWTVLPLIESAYADLREPPGATLLWVLAIRDAAPVWLALGAVLIGALVWLALRGTPLRVTRRRPAPGPEARRRQAGACLDQADLIEAGSPAFPSADSPTPAPPLLSWARESDASAADFRAIGRVYDGFARNGSEAYASWAPLGATVLLGGGAAFAYALALFTPIAELLWTLSF